MVLAEQTVNRDAESFTPALDAAQARLKPATLLGQRIGGDDELWQVVVGTGAAERIQEQSGVAAFLRLSAQVRPHAKALA